MLIQLDLQVTQALQRIPLVVESSNVIWGNSEGLVVGGDCLRTRLQRLRMLCPARLASHSDFSVLSPCC